MSPSLSHADGLPRCPWPREDPLYLAYHDEEWGVPEFDNRALYEKLVLDGFQAGLSWITILRKRENFRRAFGGFDPTKIARYTPKKVERLMQDAGIVRNRMKIEGTILSARAWLEVMNKGEGFSKLLWDFVDGKPKINRFRSTAQVPAETELSRKISKELSRRGFKFCGPTIVYAFMQAVGMVNDHLVTCHRHAECQKLALPSPPPPASRLRESGIMVRKSGWPDLRRGRSTPKAAGGG
jgi:DNA-3-methyladenine glycosylase I